ncbi:hypothetical protein ACFWYW_28470 [Nonomuraea sp. NPDC059023]|uniref:hypothetical protein n=1 Tax=unclassified Nonomuraea TaxID=2593643 RepID=UPI0036C7B964
MSEQMTPVFEDPPPLGVLADADQWTPTREALIARSGEWALILVGHYGDASKLVGRLRKSRGVWAGHEWEVAARNTLSKTDTKVYARHIKPLDSDEGDEQ